MLPAFLVWLEQTAFSTWVRESPSLFAFPGILILHAIGMGFLVGTSVAIDLRILGVAARIPLRSMKPFFGVMWLGLWINAVSGVALFIAYPTKAITNPLFHVKLALIAFALAIAVWMRRRVFSADDAEEPLLPEHAGSLAWASLAVWVAAVAAGRLLAYTYSRLMSYDL